MIDRFRGQYAFLSNFHPCEIVHAGATYRTVEHAFQAAKSLDPDVRRHIGAAPTPAAAKARGKRCQLRADWNDVKLRVMEDCLRAKFGNPELCAMLVATGEEGLVEGNTWNDRYWGVCRGTGENHLGRLLMKIRAEARAAGPRVSPPRRTSTANAPRGTPSAATVRDLLQAIRDERPVRAMPRELDRLVLRALARVDLPSKNGASRRAGTLPDTGKDLRSAYLEHLLEQRKTKGPKAFDVPLSLSDPRLRGYVVKAIRNLAIDADPVRNERRALRLHVVKAMKQPKPREAPAAPTTLQEAGRFSYERVRDAVFALRADEAFEYATARDLTKELVSRYVTRQASGKAEGSTSGMLEQARGAFQGLAGFDTWRRHHDAERILDRFIQELGQREALVLALRGKGWTLQRIADRLGTTAQAVDRLVRRAGARIRARAGRNPRTDGTWSVLFDKVARALAPDVFRTGIVAGARVARIMDTNAA